MTIAQMVIREHYNFAKVISRRFCNKIGLDITNDLEAEGFVGLVKAANSYKTGGATFKSWAAFKIRCEIRDYIKQHYRTRKGRAKRIAVAISVDELDMLCEIPSKSAEEKLCNKNLIRMLMKNIPKGWQEVVFLYYIWGYNLREIGDMKGYTKSNASRIKKAAIIKMKRSVK